MIHVKIATMPSTILDKCAHLRRNKLSAKTDVWKSISVSILLSVKHTFTLTQTSNFCKQKFKWIENKMMISWLLYDTVSGAEIT
jgi:hypothetical protein